MKISLDINCEVPYPADEKALATTLGSDQNRVREVPGYFTLQSRKIVSGMDNAFAEHSAMGIRNAAHVLKSSARTIGASFLADVCLILEDAAKKDDWNIIENNYPLVKNLFSDADVFIKTY